MKKLLNRILFKLGYTPITGFHNTLVQLVRESVRRNGEMIETDFGCYRVKIMAKDYFDKYGNRR